MSSLTTRVQSIRHAFDTKEKTKDKLIDLQKRYQEGYISFDIIIETQRILSTVADENTTRVVNFIESIINKALLQMYPKGDYYIEVKKSLRGGTNPQMEVILYTSEGKSLDLEDQAGDGISRIVSLLFSLCVIELQGVRKFVAVDEVLNGFHEDSLVIVKSILQMFVKGGFQFIMSEYDILDMGTIYEAHKHKHYSELKRLGLAQEVNYSRNLNKKG